MRLDPLKVHGVTEPGRLKQVTRVCPEHRHFAELVAVALEVPVVHGIETSQCGEQSHVGFGDGVTNQKPLPPEPFLKPVQSGEQCVVGPFVAFLAAGESALVHTVVHVVKDQVGDLVDLRPKGFGVEVRGSDPVVLDPLTLEIEGDLRVVVRNDLARWHVHNHGHGDATGVVGKPGEIGALNPVDSEHRVDSARIEVEGPAVLIVGGSGQSQRDDPFKTQQPPHDCGAVRPGACPRGHKAISTGLDGSAVPRVTGDAIFDVVGVAIEGLAGFDVTGRQVGHALTLQRMPPCQPVCSCLPVRSAPGD